MSSSTSNANNSGDRPRGYSLEDMYQVLNVETGDHVGNSAGDGPADSAGTSGMGQGALDPLLLEAEKVMTNPMFGMDAAGPTVPATPSTPAPQLLQAVALQQVDT